MSYLPFYNYTKKCLGIANIAEIDYPEEISLYEMYIFFIACPMEPCNFWMILSKFINLVSATLNMGI